MVQKMSAALLASAGTAAACFAGQPAMVLDVTPLPALPGTVYALSPTLINSKGMLAGQASAGGYHAARWSEGAGIEDLHPGPGLLVSWTKALNDSGTALGDACIWLRSSLSWVGSSLIPILIRVSFLWLGAQVPSRWRSSPTPLPEARPLRRAPEPVPAPGSAPISPICLKGIRP